MSTIVMNGHSTEQNGCEEEVKTKTTATLPQSGDTLAPLAKVKLPAENGFGYSPHVQKKPFVDASNEETVNGMQTTLTSSTSVERELVNGADFVRNSEDVKVVVEKTTTITATTETTTIQLLNSSSEESSPNTSGVENETVSSSEEKPADEKATVSSPSTELEKESEIKEEVSPSPPKTSSRPSPLPVRPSQYSIPDCGDRYIPAKSLISTRPEEGVLLRYTKAGPLSFPPILVSTMLERTTEKFPDLTALAVKRDGVWKNWTYTEMMADSKAAAKAFINFGLQRYHGVGILGFNSPEWFMANFAAIFAGGLSAGIYATNNPEACEWQLQDCRASICVVENDKQLEKILKVWPSLPHLKAVIQWIGKPAAKGHPNVYTWDEIVELGRTIPNTDLDARMADLAVNQCCTLIYTSGTTGHPKGVMLSQDNLTWTGAACASVANARPGDEIVLSYLPLSHVAAQLIDMYIPMTVGSSIYFAQPDALRGSLAATLLEVRPTVLLGVPRVWEKIQEKMVQLGSQAPAVKRSVVRWAKSVGQRGARAQDNGESLPFGWNVANVLVFKKVRQALGLDRCRLPYTGAAPIMLDTLDFFRSLNIRIFDAYGMSECSAPHTVQWPHCYRFGSSGKAIPGAITHIKDPGEDGTGEICMEGRHVFMGYLFNPELTMETLDENGWLHSGDVGKLDEDGFLYITGRIKELIITAGGENVPPIVIEDTLKAELPVLSHAMVVGDRRKFLSALLTLKTDVDPETMVPRDQLAPATIQWASSLGSKSTRLSEVLENTDLSVLKAIQAGIDRVNERATSQAQRIQKWSLLPREFSIPGGELGPTMKLRRPIVAKMYKDTIESFYNAPEN